jgi:large-conductance mechanosensitive channel
MSENVLNRDAFFSELRKFIIDNNIVGTCAGVIIALVTKDLILALVGDIIIPTFIFLFLKLNIKWLTSILPSGKSSFDLTNFFKQFVTWILTLVVTFLVIKATFESLLGISINKKQEKKEQTKKETFYSR